MLGCSTLRVKFLYNKKAPIVNKNDNRRFFTHARKSVSSPYWEFYKDTNYEKEATLCSAEPFINSVVCSSSQETI